MPDQPTDRPTTDTPEPDPHEDYAEHVVAALARVAGAMPAIGKNRRMSDGPAYNYRGVEDITAAAAPLLARECIVFAPSVKARENIALTINNKPWTECWLTVRFRIYGPGGAKDYIDVTTVGVGRDNSDKAGNKAMTAAFKYALTEVLCITDQKDDPDEYRTESDEHRDQVPDTPEELFATQDEAEALAVRLDDETRTPPEVAKAFKEWKAGFNPPWPWPRAAYGIMLTKLADMLLLWSESTGEAAERPAEAPEPSAGGTTPADPSKQASGARARTREASAPPPSEEEARASLVAANAELTRRSKYEAHVKGLKVVDVRSQLEAMQLDHSGPAPEVRERLTEALMLMAAAASAEAGKASE